MISTKKLIKMVKKWQKLAMIRQRKRISLSKNHEEAKLENCSTSAAVDKGHFVVYAADQRRFVIPLAYLSNEIFRKLLEMSEEEFGLPSDGPIVLPCDAIFIEYIILLIRQGVAAELQKALLTASRCSSSSLLHHGWIINEHLLAH